MAPGIGRRRGAVAALATLAWVFAPGVASAHETHREGDLEIVVGFGTEPAYQGQPNSVQVVLTHGAEPVTELEEPLEVDVSFGDAEPLRLALEPNFAVGAYGEPGDYRAWFIPTAAGPYTFHVSGSVNGEDIDESFTSGPDTFSEVDSGSDIQYPLQQPAATDLVERIEREAARLADTNGELRAANEAAAAAADDAEQARTTALVAIGVGLLGVAAATMAVLVARRARPRT